MSQLYPEVRDGSNLRANASQALYLMVGVEGAATVGGTAVVGWVYEISRPSEADTFFGSTSSLAAMVKYLLGRGLPSVKAVASVKGAFTAEITERGVAWANLESDPEVRIRMTDSETQAIIAAHATSATNAKLIQNRQFAISGMAAASTAAALQAAADAIASIRGVLVGPGHIANGVVASGRFSAAAVAAWLGLNPNPADDGDTAPLPNIDSIELDVQGMPLFRQKVVAGVEVNDHETLLQQGVSTLRNARLGSGVEISHLRTTYQVDSRYDALSTLMIEDEIFLGIRKYAEAQALLRKGNSEVNRDLLKSGVEALFANDFREWVEPVIGSDGLPSFNVSVIPSADMRQMILGYEGKIIRSTQTILVSGSLSIAV